MSRIAIIHYQPLEFYPPVVNTLNYLADSSELKLQVFTSKNNSRLTYSHPKVAVKRFVHPTKAENKFISLIKQFIFNLGTIVGLFFFRPDKILYYESFAAFPVFVYSKFLNRKVKVLIHFHEYFTPEWYDKGMILVKFYHDLEKKFLFKKAYWISHTNADRLRLFKNDNPFIDEKKFRELPNYPPLGWRIHKNKSKLLKRPVKVIYVGSLSLGATYIKEFCEWVINRAEEVQFDVYCFNSDAETYKYLSNLNQNNIKFYSAGVEYTELQRLLANYDVGVILYSTLHPNFVYNAPNKFFEYLACDLDIWFPHTMKGIFPYITNVSYPKVINIDFNQLDKFELSYALDRSNLEYKESGFYAEYANEPLKKELVNNT